MDTKAYAISEKDFGRAGDMPVTEYTITNRNGMRVSIINYGGAVNHLFTPDKNGEFGDVVLGYSSIEGFLQADNPYFGALIGRYANRIAGGRFVLDGKEYTLAQNNNGNSLHGGIRGFDKVMWQAERLHGDDRLKLTYTSYDGEEGYPGTVTTTVVYTLTADNELKIDYTATTDKATPINLTNHTYFNLSAGREQTILHHSLQIHADSFTPVNESLIPTGEIKPVAGGAMDFTSAKQIGKDIAIVPGGYDHNWVLNKNGNGLQLAATLCDAASGRCMEVYTTQPGIQFYSGNFLVGSLQETKNNAKYVKHAGVCLETQHFPDSPNQPAFPNTILRPGEVYRQSTVYRFFVSAHQ